MRRSGGRDRSAGRWAGEVLRLGGGRCRVRGSGSRVFAPWNAAVRFAGTAVVSPPGGRVEVAWCRLGPKL